MRLRGIVPPLVTPFRADGEIDVSAFEANVESYAGEDLAGFLVLGSNGEAASLDEDEKLTLVEAARRRSGGRTLLVGTGCESTRETIRLTCKSAELGADGVLVLTPHFYKQRMTDEALRRHFEAVADASPVPVFLYSVPMFTGIAVSAALAASLAAHPRIVGMKDSSGDMGAMARILGAVPERFSVACGSAPVLYPALCLGASAGVLAVANCAPRPVCALFRAVERGDHERARRIQTAILPLATALASAHGVPGLKAAVDISGRRGGFPRLPLLPVSGAAREEIASLLAQANDAAS
jgi:4-hydroxy-2-oxoglutarate aldolase